MRTRAVTGRAPGRPGGGRTGGAAQRASRGRRRGRCVARCSSRDRSSCLLSRSSIFRSNELDGRYTRDGLTSRISTWRIRHDATSSPTTEPDRIDAQLAGVGTGAPRPRPRDRGHRRADLACSIGSSSAQRRDPRGAHLTFGEWRLMGQLRYTGAPYHGKPGKLAEALGLSSGAMTNRLDAMERRGLVRRLPDPDDRRGVIVELTDDGHRLWETTVETQAEKEAVVASALDDEEKRELNELLRRLMHAFESTTATRPPGPSTRSPARDRVPSLRARDALPASGGDADPGGCAPRGSRPARSTISSRRGASRGDGEADVAVQGRRAGRETRLVPARAAHRSRLVVGARAVRRRRPASRSTSSWPSGRSRGSGCASSLRVAPSCARSRLSTALGRRAASARLVGCGGRRWRCCSRRSHRWRTLNEDPALDGGGASWCSPTSLAMVLRHCGVDVDGAGGRACRATTRRTAAAATGRSTSRSRPRSDLDAVVTRLDGLTDATAILAAGIPLSSRSSPHQARCRASRSRPARRGTSSCSPASANDGDPVVLRPRGSRGRRCDGSIRRRPSSRVGRRHGWHRLPRASGDLRRFRRRRPVVRAGQRRTTTERRAHAARPVVGERAPQDVAPRQRGGAASSRDAARCAIRAIRRVVVPRADPAQREVVIVLAEVDELDDRRSRAERRAREHERELVGRDLQARRCAGSRGGRAGETAAAACRTTAMRRAARACASAQPRSQDRRVARRGSAPRQDRLGVARRASPRGARRRASGSPWSRAGCRRGRARRGRGTRRSSSRARACRSGSPRPPRRGRCRSSRSPAARRPNSDQTWTSTRSARPRASRSRWNASSAVGRGCKPLGERRRPGRRACRRPRARVSATQRSGQPGGEHRRETGEPAREVVVPRGRRRGSRTPARLAVLARGTARAVGRAATSAARLASPARAPGRRGGGSRRARRSRRASAASTSPHTPRAQKSNRSGASIEATGHALRRERGLQAPVEREPLERVVGRAVAVEVAAEPAGREALVERADLPEVARGEVRLVRVGVADRRG